MLSVSVTQRNAAAWNATVAAMRTAALNGALAASWCPVTDTVIGGPWDEPWDEPWGVTWDAALAAYNVKMEQEKNMDNQMVDNQVVEKLERFILECVEFSHNCLDGGNQWSGEGALLSFARDSLKLDIDWSRWRAYEELILRSGPRFVYKDFCVITDRFEYLHPADDQNRPHNADGPTHRYRCGTELYHWHGLPVPRFWIMEKEKLDPSLALTHANAEMRRVVAEIVGWDRVLERLSPKTIDQDVDPEIGTLLEADLPEAPRSRFLKVQYTTASGVTKHYVLPVPNTMQTAIEANCWTYPGLTPELLRNRQARV